MVDVLTEFMRRGENPMFGISEILRMYCQAHGLPAYGVDSNHHLYRKITYWLRKMEDELGLLYSYRVTNGGTVYMLRERAK